jgi:Flp pilus assembly protein TadD
VTIPRFLALLIAALLVQSAVFAWRYSDLLYLSRPVPAIVNGGADSFARYASEALARPRVTKRHLDTIAEAAARLDQHEHERLALERRLALSPQDDRIRLRLADALMRAGEREAAERQYLEVLRSSPNELP